MAEPNSLDVAAARRESMMSHRADSGQVALVFPIHSPRALLAAFRMLPVEAWGPKNADASLGGTHLQAYVCSIAQRNLAFVLGDRLRPGDIDLIVAPHACDSLQGLASLLLDLTPPRVPVFPLYQPRGTRESDINFYAAELMALSERLADLVGWRPSDDELLAAVREDEEADRLLKYLSQAREHLGVSLRELYALLRSREYLSAARFGELARRRLSAAGLDPDATFERAPAGSSGGYRVPLILSGIVPEPDLLFDHLESGGAWVAADDLACCGRRLYPPGQSERPFRRMAERLINGPPDPTRGSPIAARAEHLLALARETGAKGVVFYTVKFCEPELFDIPSLTSRLSEAGLASLVIEVDIGQPLSHQSETRIEAFLEMLP